MRPGGSELQPYEKALHVLPPTFNGDRNTMLRFRACRSYTCAAVLKQ